MQFRYTLIDYIINPSGIARVVPEPLGWDGLTLKLERDKEYHGFFEYSDDEMAGLKFYNQGHDILKNAFDTYGIEAKVELKIEILCSPQVVAEEDEGDADQWLQLFYGRIDFDRTRFECGLKGCFAEAAATTSTCLMALRNRFDQKVDLDSLKSFDSTTNNLTPYSKLNFDMDLPEQSLVKMWSGSLNEPFVRSQPVSGFYDINTSVVFQIPFDNVISDTLIGVTNEDWIIPHIPLPTPGVLADFGENTAAHGKPFLVFPSEEDGVCAERIYIKGHFTGELKDESNDEEIGLEHRNFNMVFTIAKVWVSGVYEVKYTSSPVLASCTGCATDSIYTFDFSIDENFTMEPGEKLFMFFHVKDYDFTNTTSGGVPVSNYPTVILTVNSANLKLFSPSNCGEVGTIKTYLINEALSRTVEGVTNDCLRVYSDYFGRKDSQPYNRADTADGCGSLAVITNGLKIRNAYMKDGTLPRLQVSFKELVEGLNAIHCIGYGLEKDETRSTDDDTYYLLRVEPFHYFYKNTLLLQCLNVPALKSSVLADQYVSTYKTGYAKWEAEEEGGMDDFFGQREYRTVLSTINKTLDKVCKFIASGYSTEVTRRQIGTDNTDWRYDNDVFILCVKRKPDNSFEIERGNITANENLFDTATVINAFISPVRNAMRWMRYLAQNIANVWDNSFLLYFTAGQGNYVAQTQINNTCKQEHIADTLPENADLRYATFEDFDTMKPLMYNIVDEFEYPLSFKAYMNIVASPYGRIKYSCNNGEQYYGFIKLIKYKPTDGKATFQLLRAYTD